MEAKHLQILYEDNHLLAAVKPAGLLVQGDRSGDPTLLAAARAYLKDRYAKPGNVYLGLVHRLDRPVSGVVLFARTSKAAGRLSAQFRRREVEKNYLVVVTGRPPVGGGEVVAHLAPRGDRQGVTRAAWEAFPGSRLARLVYTVVESSAGSSLLAVELLTGRRHQIRAQLGLLGHPVLGDVKYGAGAALPDRSIALHAQRLAIAHPVGGQPLAFAAPLPAAWPWPPETQPTRRKS